jgi:hypothetical protein
MDKSHEATSKGPQTHSSAAYSVLRPSTRAARRIAHRGIGDRLAVPLGVANRCPGESLEGLLSHMAVRNILARILHGVVSCS